MIGIVNYGAGNLQSVKNAVDNAGYNGHILNNAEQTPNCSGLVLPGVGSFADAMKKLNKEGWVEEINRHLDKGKKMMGICLGMQLLFEEGSEGGLTKGLALIEGSVKRFNEGKHRVPHVGWNTVRWAKKNNHPCIERVKSGIDFYHVHSYICEPKSEKVILGTCEYGSNFVTAIAKENIVGYQFHPEKSQPAGQQLIENFCNWCTC